MSRDDRQRKVYEWVLSTFGESCAETHERALRLFEETCELCQAEGIEFANVLSVLNYVYSRPVGDAKLEVGGVGTTLLAYCEAIGVSANRMEKAETKRILQSDPEYFRRRNNAKIQAGVALPKKEAP